MIMIMAYNKICVYGYKEMLENLKGAAKNVFLWNWKAK